MFCHLVPKEMTLSDRRPIIERSKTEEARLAVSRHAAELFWKHGVDGTSGDAIAEASGLSKRTVWRYFRSKEACVEPLLLGDRVSICRVAARMAAERFDRGLSSFDHGLVHRRRAGHP